VVNIHLPGYLEPIRKVDKYLSEVRLWRKRYTVLIEVFKLMNIIKACKNILLTEGL